MYFPLLGCEKQAGRKRASELGRINLFNPAPPEKYRGGAGSLLAELVFILTSIPLRMKHKFRQLSIYLRELHWAGRSTRRAYNTRGREVGP
jgi:hypothetical protein